MYYFFIIYIFTLFFVLHVNQSGSNPAKDLFPPSEVKKWAIDDLQKTISWLDSQEEKVSSTLLSCFVVNCYCLYLTSINEFII